MAALWPPSALTAPPRLAPEPQSRIRSCSVATPQRSGGSAEVGVVLGERPRQRPVEDVAARHPQRVLDVERGLGLDARAAVAVGEQHVGERLAEHGVERAEHRRLELGAPGVVGRLGEQPVGRVQPEHRQRLRPARAQLRRQDAGVGQRVAVDLDGQRARDRGAGRPAAVRYASSSARQPSFAWKVPPNAAAGSRLASRSRGRRFSSRLTLTCAPSGARRACRARRAAATARRARRSRAPSSPAIRCSCRARRRCGTRPRRRA